MPPTNPDQLRRIARALAEIDTVLASLAPRAGFVSRLVAMSLRCSLHRSIVCPCPYCETPHRGIDLPDGSVAELRCVRCERLFEVAVNELGDLDVYGRPASQVPLPYDESEV